MRFTTFKIPPKEPNKEDNGKYTCNARIRVNDEEAYCQDQADGNARCPNHNTHEKLRASREEAELRRVVDTTSVGERVAELEKDKRNLTKLDELILNSLATIQEMEKRYPLSAISPGDALSIARLREKHAALVHQRVDLESKLKNLLDSDFIFEQAAELFEKNVTDKNTQKILLEGIGTMLDKLVQSGKATAHEDST